MKRKALILLLGMLLPVAALAQNPTGVLSGQVAADGEPVPGVTVTATSPSLQGDRVVQTTANGDYLFRGLPPGDYTIRFELQGFQTAEKTLKISAAQSAQIDVGMTLDSLSEEIIVTGEFEAISQTAQSATTYQKMFLEELPVNRDLVAAVVLAPGVAANGPGDSVVISGAQSHENLFLVNGVVVNENLRGQPNDLFIEDAIQETTTSTSAISAEFGRFAGGVVTVLTKSGGNDFAGSLRTNFANEDWEARTPITVQQADDVNEIYEATLGGYLWKDRLWFFLAARDLDTAAVNQTALTNLSFADNDSETRLEGKLTLKMAEGHSLVGSYMKIEEEDSGVTFGSVLDLKSVYNRELPQELFAGHYSGVLGSNFFVEAQYSEREFSFVGSGAPTTDLILGTLLVDRQTGNRWHSPTFCGVCEPDEQRNNENFLIKGSGFISSDKLGSHDLVFGYDTFNDIRLADNHQSGSDFRILISRTVIDPDGVTLYPVLQPGRTGNAAFIQYNPILQTSQGTDFVTNSIFLNDSWRLNNHLSFNLGLRYDQNDGKDASDAKVVDDSKISPRLAMTYDPSGKGDWLFTGSYAEYVTAIANTQASAASAAGAPATITWWYEGPAVNTGSATVGAEDALRTLFTWFDSVGGINSNPTRSIAIPGGTTVINESLSSPSTIEFTVGASKRLGSRGLVRADLVHREGRDFYADRRDLSTGRVTLPNGTLADLSVVENHDSLLSREYNGLHLAFIHRPTDRLNLGGNYTLSKTEGNVDGETRASGPVRSGILSQPEYFDKDWSNPEGYLRTDQRHRLRFWAGYDLFNTSGHRLNVSALQRFASGLGYEAVGAVDTRPFVTNPGYVRPPTAVTYFFSDRGSLRSDDLLATDLALNYSFHWGLFGQDVEIFVQPEILNIFNQQKIASTDVNFFDTTVIDATNTGATSCNGSPCARFNPFTETPVEGVHWAKGPDFGQAIDPAAYQTPRTFRVSIGVRF